MTTAFSPLSGMRELAAEARATRHLAPRDTLPATFLDVVPASFHAFVFEDLTTSDAANRAAALAEQTRIAEELTGDRTFRPLGSGLSITLDEDWQRWGQQEERVRELQALHPEAGLRTAAELEKDIAEEAGRRRQRLEAALANASPVARFFGQLVGMGGASMLDPLNVAAMGLAVPRAAGIARRALVAAGINAGSEAAIQATAVYDYKQRLGSPYSVRDAALASLAAGVFGGAFQGAADLAALGWRRMPSGTWRRRTPGPAGGEATVGDLVRDALERGELEATPELRQALDVLEAADDLARTSPEGAAPDQLQRHADAMQRAARDVGAGQTAREGLEGVTVSDIGAPASTGAPVPASYLGTRAGMLEAMDPESIGVDAVAYQFKSGGDAAGVTERLRGVERWDPTKAGLAIVHERADGSRWIVDGHQRLGLAKRAQAAGQRVELHGLVLREADGVTVADARIIAAAKNIAEGTGTAVDAARVLRDAGDFEALNLPPRSALVRDARGLARLGPEGWGVVVNGKIDERFAAIVGDRIADHGEQLVAIRALLDADPANVTQAAVIVEDVRAAGFVEGEQGDIFGGRRVVSGLYAERAKVLDGAIRRLREDRRLFAAVVQGETDLAEAGNVLDTATNTARLTKDEAVLAYVTRLATSKGPVSDALSEAAQALKAGGSRAASERAFVERVRGLIESGELRGAGAPKAAPAPEPEPAPVVDVEPEVVHVDDQTLDMFGGAVAREKAEAPAPDAPKGETKAPAPETKPASPDTARAAAFADVLEERAAYLEANPHSGGALTGDARAFDALADDAEVVVFHATSEDNAAALLAGKGKGKRQGGGIRGKSADLYVGADPVAVEGYGPKVLAIRVRKGDLTMPPEAAGKATVGEAIVDAGVGATFAGKPLAVLELPDGARYSRGFEALREASGRALEVEPVPVREVPRIDDAELEDLFPGFSRSAELDPSPEWEAEVAREFAARRATGEQLVNHVAGVDDVAGRTVPQAVDAGDVVDRIVAEEDRLGSLLACVRGG